MFPIIYEHYKLVEKNIVSLKTFYNKAYRTLIFIRTLFINRKIVGKSKFLDQFEKQNIINSCNRMGYDLNDILRHTACMVVNPVTVSRFDCAEVGRPQTK